MFRSPFNLFRFAVAGLALVVAVWSSDVALAQDPDPNLGRAMDAVFNGPQVKKLKILRHEFNVKPARFTRRAGRNELVIEGRISHCLRWRPDDQLDYRIVKNGDGVVSISTRINRGGLLSVPGKVIKPIAFVPGTKLTLDLLEAATRELFRAGRGSWESAANFIVTSIALRANMEGQDQIVLLRRAARVKQHRLQTAVQSTTAKVVGKKSARTSTARNRGNVVDHREK